jgi:hypothetical protein
MISVYHRDFETNTDVLVAEVLTDSLESAYHMTQNLNGSWSKTRLVFAKNDQLVKNPDFHPEVQVMAPLHVVRGREYGLRSTMVNDIMVKDGVKYRVAMVGFKQVA